MFSKPSPIMLTAAVVAFLAFAGALPAQPVNGYGMILSTSSVHSGHGVIQEEVPGSGTSTGNGDVLVSAVSDPCIGGTGVNGWGHSVIVGPAALVLQLAEDTPSGVAGDVNNDGVLSPEDALAALHCYLAGGCATPNKTAVADLCPGPGPAVTPRDAQAIFEVFLGLTPECPE